MQDWLESGPRLPVDGRLSGGRPFGGRAFGRWRIAVSAWLVVIALVVLLAAAHALGSRNSMPLHQGDLAGAVIPRHDPSFAGPDEVAASDALERAKAEAYTGW